MAVAEEWSSSTGCTDVNPSVPVGSLAHIAYARLLNSFSTCTFARSRGWSAGGLQEE